MSKDKIYPCDDCGKLRTAEEGGRIFNVCDKCWDLHYGTPKEIKLTPPRDLDEGKLREIIRDAALKNEDHKTIFNDMAKVISTAYRSGQLFKNET